jgi:hypothetical protein
MKKFIRKIAAVGAGSAVLFGTMAGALAAGETLADMPAPFIVNDAYADVAMVVGADAGSNDNAARTTVKGYFDDYAIGTGVGEITASSDIQKLYFGENLSQEFSADLDDGKISTLWDDGIDFRGENYETSEHINVSTSDTVYLATSGISAEEKLGPEAKLYTSGTTMSWGYLYEFDEDFTANVTSDHELKIDFLGKEIRISDTNAATEAVTITTGTQKSMKMDSTAESDGHTIHIGTIFSTSVEVWVDDATHAYSDEGDEETFDVAGGTFEVKIDEIGYTEDVESRSVLVTFGDDISTTVKNGDAVQLELDEPDVDDDAGDATWNWAIQINNENTFNGSAIGDYIGVDWSETINKYDDDPAPIGSGEYWSSPLGFVTLDFNIPEQTYQEYTIELLENFETENATSDSELTEDVIKFTAVGNAASNDGLTIAGTDTYQAVINGTGFVRYYDDNKDWVEATGAANSTTCGTGLCFEPSSDTTKYIVAYNASGEFTTVASQAPSFVVIEDVESADENAYTGSTFLFNVSVSNSRLGNTVDVSDVADLVYYEPYGTAANHSIGTWDENGGEFLSMYGIKVLDIESDTESDMLTFWIPHEEVYGEVTFNIRSSGSTVEPMLTTESGAAGYDNLILVGGPCVNSLTADYMGLTYPACEAASTITENKGLLKLIEDAGKTALIVAGWEIEDTKKAAEKLAAGGLTGTEVIVE